MTEFLLKWPGSGYPGKKRTIVPGYLKAGHNLVKFANAAKKTEKITRAIHYDTWVDLCPTTDIEFIFNVDEDFEDVLNAVRVGNLLRQSINFLSIYFLIKSHITCKIFIL